jgi:hypothetical protein
VEYKKRNEMAYKAKNQRNSHRGPLKWNVWLVRKTKNQIWRMKEKQGIYRHRAYDENGKAT